MKRKSKKQELEELKARLQQQSNERFEQSRKTIRKYMVIGFAFAILIATILFLNSLNQVPEEPINPNIGVISSPAQVPVNNSDTAEGTNLFPPFNWWLVGIVIIIFWINKRRWV